MSVTLVDVAERAGVSLATASRVLNGSARVVSGAFRERVERAATELGYRTNLQAQAIARGSSRMVALLVSDIADPYFSAIAAGVERGARERGLVVTIAVTGREASSELELLRELQGFRPALVVIAGGHLVGDEEAAAFVAELAALRADGGLVVRVGQPMAELPAVRIANHEGASALASALVERGHRRFAVIAGPEALDTSRERLGGFRAGLAAAGIALDDGFVVHEELTREGGAGGARTLAERGLGDIDCVFAVTDLMAIGAMTTLRDAGLQVPCDVAVAGFDDITFARDASPQLTTVRVDLEAAGALAIDAAFDGDDGVVMPATVVVRASA